MYLSLCLRTIANLHFIHSNTKNLVLFIIQLKIYKEFQFLEKAVRQVLSDTVGISETASTSDIATHDMSNMVDVQAIVTAMADMEAQRKEQEQQFAVRMQDILEKTTESLETELKQVKQYNKELMESNIRIEAHLTKRWWQKLFDRE
ncbi:hypothetical protein [Peribacillus butanolivorans]|uniref:hypothetical protein n=1 Tax=Peribacillus butanolivorans TaxID=421767 RepID=UPI003CFCF084